MIDKLARHDGHGPLEGPPAIVGPPHIDTTDVGVQAAERLGGDEAGAPGGEGDRHIAALGEARG